MTKREIGWVFPPTHGGQETGFHDAGIETFSSRPLSSLAREVIQNSLDARDVDDNAVYVSFEIRTVKQQELFGITQLREHVNECIKATDDNQRKAIQFFSEAQKILSKQVSFLRIHDENTKGLRKKEWEALVKQTGTSMKDKEGAGGSFGIGKHAPFAVSQLRTVFYWTCYTEDENKVEKFQGKSILISHLYEHKGKEVMSQGIGFYGDSEECTALHNDSIPDVFRVLNRKHQPILGTALWIAGFRNESEWQFDIAQNVIENFFYAINKGDLEITLEFDTTLGIGEDLSSISSTNLKDWLNHLKTEFENSDERSDELQRVEKTISFLRLFEEGEAFTKEIDELGKCELWILVDKKLPSEVALFRGTGMLITCEQEGLRRFPQTKEFIAACVLNSENANVLLRDMENPEHNHFDVNRLLEEDRARGKRALNQLADWIRTKVNECAKDSNTRSVSNVNELASYLPDIDTPGSLNQNAANKNERTEKAFGVPGRVRVVPPSYKPTAKVRPKPPTPPPPPPPPDPTPGPIPEPDPAPNPVPPEPKPTPKLIEIKLEELRVIPSTEDSKRVKVIFKVDYTGEVRLELLQATDDQPERRSDLDLIFTGENSVSSCSVRSGHPFDFQIRSSRDIVDIAWILRAYKTN